MKLGSQKPGSSAQKGDKAPDGPQNDRAFGAPLTGSTTGIFALAVDGSLFIPLFVAEATYLAAYLSNVRRRK